MTTTTFRERLEQALNSIPGATRADLARACKVSQPSVHAWFSGTSSMSGKSLAKAAAFLKVSELWLMEGRGSMHPKEGEGASPLYEDKLSQRSLRVVSRLADVEGKGAASPHLYQIIEHALALTLDHPSSAPGAVLPADEREALLALYERLQPNQRQALVTFIQSLLGE